MYMYVPYASSLLWSMFPVFMLFFFSWYILPFPLHLFKSLSFFKVQGNLHPPYSLPRMFPCVSSQFCPGSCLFMLCESVYVMPVESVNSRRADSMLDSFHALPTLPKTALIPKITYLPFVIHFWNAHGYLHKVGDPYMFADWLVYL